MKQQNNYMHNYLGGSKAFFLDLLKYWCLMFLIISDVQKDVENEKL